MAKELISYLEDPVDAFKRLQFDYELAEIKSAADVAASLQAADIVLKRQYLEKLDSYIKIQEQESVLFSENDGRAQVIKKKCKERIAAANILKSAFSNHLKGQSLAIMLAEEQRVALRDSFAIAGSLADNFFSAFSGLPSLLWPIITVKNSIKLVAEHLPSAIGTANHTLMDYFFIHWPDESSYPSRWRRWLALVGSAMGVAGSGLLYALASVVHQTTRRLTSPLASFKEAGSIHPVLGVGSALLSVAWGMLATAIAAPVTIFFAGKIVGAQAAAGLTSFFAKLGAAPALQKIGHVVATLAQPVWDVVGVTASPTAITGTAVLGGILTAVLNPLRALVGWIWPGTAAVPTTPPPTPVSPCVEPESKTVIEDEKLNLSPDSDLEVGPASSMHSSPTSRASEQAILNALAPVPPEEQHQLPPAAYQEPPELTAVRQEAESLADIASSSGDFSPLQELRSMAARARNWLTPRVVSVEAIEEGDRRSSPPDLHR